MLQGRYFTGTQPVFTLTIYLWDKLFRKSLIDEYQILFPETFKRAEDVAFVQCYMSVADSVYMLNSVLYNHYDSIDGSLMNSINQETEQEQLLRLLDNILIMEFSYDFMKKYDRFDRNRDYFISWVLEDFRYIFVSLRREWERPFLKGHEFFLQKLL